MEYKLEKISETRRRINVTVEKVLLDNEVEKILREVQRKAEIKGFRKGKAPMEIIKNYYGRTAEREAMEELVKATLPEIFKKEGLSPLHPPVLERTSVTSEGFTYSVRFEVLPHVDPAGYEKIKIKVKDIVITEKDVQEVIENLRKKHAILQPVEDREEVIAGDVVEVEPLSGERRSLLLIVEKDDEFEGKKKGEVVEVKNEARKVRIRKIFSMLLPELNDDFARTLGEPSFDELKNKIRKELEEKRERTIRTRIHNAILGELIRLNPFEAPQTLVEDEFNELKGQFEGDETSLRRLAEERVKAEILLYAISRKENITSTEEEVDKELERLSKETGKRKEVLMADTSLKRKIEDSIIRKKTLEMLEKRCEVQYEAEK